MLEKLGGNAEVIAAHADQQSRVVIANRLERLRPRIDDLGRLPGMSRLAPERPNQGMNVSRRRVCAEFRRADIGIVRWATLDVSERLRLPLE